MDKLEKLEYDRGRRVRRLRVLSRDEEREREGRQGVGGGILQEKVRASKTTEDGGDNSDSPSNPASKR